MTTSIENTKGASGKIVLSIDAMGGDRGPAAVVAGIARAAKQNAHLHFILHGKKIGAGSASGQAPGAVGPR